MSISRNGQKARSEVLRRTWRGMKLGWWDQLMRTQNGPVNLHAANMEADSQQAMGIAQSGDMQFALYSSNLVCLDEDRDKLHESARLIMKTIQNLGYSNVRRVPLHTLNLADMLPITSVWAGLRENPSALMPKNSPPLLYAATTGATPFRFHLHVSDLGHTIVVGPSSSGKSTLLGLIAAQWFRYPNAQVFSVDKGYSSWVLTQAVGGIARVFQRYSSGSVSRALKTPGQLACGNPSIAMTAMRFRPIRGSIPPQKSAQAKTSFRKTGISGNANG